MSAGPTPAGWWRSACALGLLWATVGFVWLPAIGRWQGFWFDDYLHIAFADSHGLHGPAALLPWAAAHRPLGRDAFSLLWWSCRDPEGMRLIQLAIHALAATTLAMTLRGVFRSWAVSIPATLVVALSPTAYHPILWSAAVFDLVALVCAIAAFAAWTHRRQTSNARGWALLVATAVALLLALKAKESMLLLPITFAVATIAFDGPWRWTTWLRWPQDAPDASRVPPPPTRTWVLVAVLCVLVAIMASCMPSDARAAQDPSHPYFVRLSPWLSLNSFGYYFAALAFAPADPGSIGGALALAACVGAGMWLRSGPILLGTLWILSVCGPASLLANHSKFLFYPYVASMGAALVVGGAVYHARTRLRPAHLRVAAVVVVLILTARAAWWCTRSPIARWHENVHRANRHQLAELQRVLPAPASGTTLVLVIPNLSAFSHHATSVVRFVYGEPSLAARLFTDEAAAEAARAPGVQTGSWLTWTGSTFERRSRSDKGVGRGE